MSQQQSHLIMCWFVGCMQEGNISSTIFPPAHLDWYHAAIDDTSTKVSFITVIHHAIHISVIILHHYLLRCNSIASTLKHQPAGSLGTWGGNPASMRIQDDSHCLVPQQKENQHSRVQRISCCTSIQAHTFSWGIEESSRLPVVWTH